MQRYEYKVVPAPGRGEKVRGAKTGAERFAATVQTLMNSMGAEGWEYVRADTLPAEERTGFTGRTTVYHNLLVFRREVGTHDAVATPVPDPAPRLTFPRLRLGGSKTASTAPKVELDPPAGPAPKVGPATPSEDDPATRDKV